MNYKKGTVHPEQGMELGFALRGLRVSVLEKQETAAFKGLLSTSSSLW